MPQVLGDGGDADSGAVVEPGGVVEMAVGGDGVEQAALIGVGGIAGEQPGELTAQVLVEFGGLVGAGVGQAQRRHGAGGQARFDDRGGVIARSPQQDRFPPPGVTDLVGEDAAALVVTRHVGCGQVFLQAQVGEAVVPGLVLEQQAAAAGVVEKRLRGQRRAGTVRESADRRFGVGDGDVTLVLEHHRPGQPPHQPFLGVAANFVQGGVGSGEVLGLLASVQQHLAHLGVQVGAAAGQAAAVTVHVGDHRQEQRVGS